MPIDAQTITDPARIQNYLRDESWAFEGHADCLYLPGDEDALASVLGAANRRGTPVTVSAGGTSITGARVPLHGGAVISVERMTRVPDRPGAGAFERFERAGCSILVDREARRAILPPAVPLTELDAILEPRGLLYPPDPTELAAMISGTVATNASGARSFHYGPTRAWVRRLRVVLPDGGRLELTRTKKGPGTLTPGYRVPFSSGAAGRVLVVETEHGSRHVTLPDPADYPLPACKNAAGLYLMPGMDAIDLFIGGEGILGVLSEIEVALLPRPAETLTVIAYFPDLGDILDFVDFGVGERERFLSLEFFDGRSLDLMRPRYPGVPAACAGAVLFEVPYRLSGDEGPYPPVETVEELRRTLARFHAGADWVVPTQQREMLRLFRHALPETVNDFARAHEGKLGTDMAVPHATFREMYAAYGRAAETTGVRTATWGHIGDDHLHLNFLSADAGEMKRARAAYVELARTAVALGGTVSAEHGVGKKQFEVEPGHLVPYLALMFDEQAMRAIARVKRAFDPNWILNAGNVIPREAATWT